MSVLDLATGTGEPALSLAEAVGARGHVTATDLTREMLDVTAPFTFAEAGSLSTASPPT